MSMLALQPVGADGALAGWLLPLLVLLPILYGVGLTLVPWSDLWIRRVALGATGLIFVLSLVVAWVFDWSNPGTFQLEGRMAWLTSLGVSLHVGVDSVSLWLVLLTTFMAPLTILGTWNDAKERVREFYVWLLVLQGALIGVFVARDMILFYIFFEMTLVPLFFLIGIFGSIHRHYAAAKFFIFTLTGSLLTLASVIYVAFVHAQNNGAWNFDMATLVTTAQGMSFLQQSWVLAGLLAGFSVKVPLFPVHTWLPLAHTEAPAAGSVVLAAVLLKLGTYGLLRLAIPMAPQALLAAAPWIAGTCVVGILYAAAICWVQTDFKKLVAYSSISHMGFCVLGMLALNPPGVSGSVMYMISHGLSTGALFLCVGMIYSRYHTKQFQDLGGLGHVLPIWSTFLVFFCLASVGLPGLNGFVGEFLTLLGAFTAGEVYSRTFAVIAAPGLVLSAIYILYLIGRVVLGPLKTPAHPEGEVHDLNSREIAALAPIALACLVLGFYPKPILKPVDGAFDQLMRGVRPVPMAQAAPSTKPAPDLPGLERADTGLEKDRP